MKKNNKKGFTLVELVIVVAVMAVLVAVAIPTVKSITSSATEAVNETNARTIESVLKLKEAEMSKSSNDVATVKAADAAVALYEAKLGIEDKTFYYTIATGKCGVEAPATGTDTSTYFVINFANMESGKYTAATTTTAAKYENGSSAFVTGGPTA